MKSSIYSVLQDGPKSMRIIRLAPSGKSGPVSISAELVETTWDGSTYEALSYCWGKQRKLKKMLLNGEQFEVTADLYEALEHFQLENDSRALWHLQVDAVCINQNDADEKSLQVQRMQDIYRNAEKVLVWIGQAPEHTKLAFEKVKSLLVCDDVDSQKHIWDKQGEWIDCLGEIIMRPYWSRAWTVQEVVLAKTALLCCGHHSIPFFDFSTVLLRGITRERVKVTYALSNYLRLVFEMRKSSYQDPPTGLFGLAFQLRHRQCTVYHDRIYAFLGLLRRQDLSTDEFQVDYNMKTDQLWMAFSKATMSRYKTLLPVVLAEDSFDSWRPTLPRWCYNWSQKPREPNDVWHSRRLFWTAGLDSPDYYPLQAVDHSAAGGLAARVDLELEVPSVISVQGFTVSKVVKIGRNPYASLGRPNYIRLFTDWEKMVGGPWEDPEMKARFSHTVTAGAWNKTPADWRVWNKKDYAERLWSPTYLRDEFVPNFWEDKAGYNMSPHETVDSQQDEIHRMYTYIRDSACEERVMFLLENGDYGLGPQNVKVGDAVAILLGSQVPLVLHERDLGGTRRWLDWENKADLYKSIWKVVGQAYVHSMMKYRGDLDQDIQDGKVILQDFHLD
ncbi:hypothetical protein F66182_6066 [Fusarium sp. NRRL 66182]|nr:hypothetical protein F66182_6066 [Fusarium sp. NRRL 66182]